MHIESQRRHQPTNFFISPAIIMPRYLRNFIDGFTRKAKRYSLTRQKNIPDKLHLTVTKNPWNKNCITVIKAPISCMLIYYILVLKSKPPIIVILEMKYFYG